MTPAQEEDPREQEAVIRRATRAVVIAFVTAIGGAALFVFAYWQALDTQWLGLGLAVALGGVGWGLIAMGHRLMPQGPDVEERERLASAPGEEAATAGLFRGRGEQVRRRSLLGRLLLTALGAVGLTTLVPIRSFGPRPRSQLRTTPWGQQPPTRVMTGEEELVRVDALQIGGLLTVFPEGHPASADGQAILLRLSDRDLERATHVRRDWAVEGNIAFSKVCTHAGCPVGLYQPEQQTVLCPCHQSTFDVLAGALPTRGPAVRRLPQLPLDVDDEGVLVATGDFPEPVGPGYWTRPRDEGREGSR